MTDESELRMEGLKKAYAEIILNTSKEAALRVMKAQHNALSYQQQLVSLKQESLRMLLRYKDNFNSKITEAEARSLNQQMKIEELEAQLCEAEGIIVDLREELKLVLEQLEITRFNSEKLSDRRTLSVCEPIHECVPQNNALNSSPVTEYVVSDTKLIPLDYEMHETVANNKHSEGMTSTDSVTGSLLNKFDASDDDMASVTPHRGKNYLYRNGCTEREHGTERNLSTIKLSSPRTDQPVVNIQSEISSERADNRSQSPVIESELIPCNSTLCKERMDNAIQSQPTSVSSLQNMEKCGISGSNLKINHFGMLRESCTGSSELSYCEPEVDIVGDNVNCCEEPFSLCSFETEKKQVKKTQTRLKDQAARSLRRSAGKNARYRAAIAALRSCRKKSLKSLQQPVLHKCKVHSSGVNNQTVEVPVELIESMPKITKGCCVYQSDHLRRRSYIKLSHSDVSSGGEFANVVSSEQGTSARSSSVSQSDLSSPVPVHALLVDSKLVDIAISVGLDYPQCPVNDGRLKYTFHRKRRKTALAEVDENIIPDRSTM